MITIFENILSTTSPYFITIERALQRIKNGKSKVLIEAIRSEEDKEKRNELKKQLPSICFSGEFDTRSDNGIKKHSGYICLDFDNVEDKEQLKEKLSLNPYTYSVFVSPSGNGLKVICKIMPDVSKHEGCFLGLQENYNEESFDKSCKNISRVCYESFDPKIYINPNSKTFNEPIEKNEYEHNSREPEIKLKDAGKIFKRLVNGLNKSDTYQQGNRNNYIFKLSCDCCNFGITQSEAFTLISFDFHGLNESELKETISKAYKHATPNSKYFENTEAVQVARQLIENGIKKNEIPGKLQMMLGDINTTEATKATEKAEKSLSNRIETFWRVCYDKKKGEATKIEFMRMDFLRWLSTQGVGLYYYSKNNWKLVRVVKNIVSELDVSSLKRLVFDYIAGLPSEFDFITCEQLLEFIARGVNVYFNPGLIESMTPIEIDWNKDTKGSAWFYFENIALEVTATGKKQYQYKDLPGCIWDTQIISQTYKDYKGDNYGNYLLNDYSEFLYCVMNKDSDQTTALMTVIGYLLHSYKNRRESPAVVMMDEIISDDPNGGTGKGLFIHGIRQMKRMVTIDGKNFDFRKSFPFQRVNLDTEIIALEDIQKDFDFEMLFSIITEGLAVEKKNKDEFYMDFESSPKVIITTNYTIKGDGNSNQRRQLEIEFSQFFNGSHTPFDEFKRILFADWDADHWQRFIHFMLECTVFYLKNGIIKPTLKNLSQKKFINSTCIEFAEWVEITDILREPNNAHDIIEAFRIAHPDFTKLTMRTFNKWLSRYADYYKLKWIKSRSGNTHIYTFKGKIDHEAQEDQELPF